MNDLTLADVVSSGGPVNRRRSARAAERRRKRRRRRTWVSLLIVLAVLAGAVSLAWFTILPVIHSLTAPKDWPGPGTGVVMVTIAPNATGRDMAQALQEAGVVKTVNAFVDAANQDPRSGQIQPGIYAVKREMAAADALAILENPANRVVSKVTINEGWRVSQIADAMVKAKIPRADVDAALKNPAAIGLPAQARGLVEGWLFPATYELTPTTTAAQLLGQMVDRTVQELTELQVPQAKWQQTIIMASLVQAEGGTAQDAPKIARVLYNRIARAIPLQLNTTVNYAMNRFRVAMSYKETRFASPYNTYLHAGLPPGAISNPGTIALTAVLSPTAGDWIYFVAVNPDTGLTKFGVTVADFDAMMAELNTWLKAHPGR